MSLVLIDLDGSTLEEFGAPSSLRRFLRAGLAHDPRYADDLAVLTYQDGERVGRPMPAADFVSDPTPLVAAAAHRALQDSIRISTSEGVRSVMPMTRVSVHVTLASRAKLYAVTSASQHRALSTEATASVAAL